jgi:phosphoribosylglycinamide formyltransferase-1
LDALKWAIYEGKTIGVTSHYISREVDAGAIIERRIVPVYWNDTFHSLAFRQYGMEIEMLAGAVDFMGEAEPVTGDIGTPHRRMSRATETAMMARFIDLLIKKLH